MPDLELLVRVEVDGQPAAGFPLYRRLALGEVQGFSYQRASDPGLYKEVPEEEIDKQLLIALRVFGTNGTVRIAGQNNAGIPLHPRGLLIIFNGTCGEQGALIKVLNESGRVIDLRGIAGGQL